MRKLIPILLLCAGIAWAADQIERPRVDAMVKEILDDAQLTSVEKDAKLDALVKKCRPLERGRVLDVVKRNADFEVVVCGMHDGTLIRNFTFSDEEVGTWKKWDRVSWTDRLCKEDLAVSYWPEVKVPGDLNRVPNPGFEPFKIDPKLIGTQKQFIAWLRAYTNGGLKDGWSSPEFEKGAAKYWLIPGSVSRVDGNFVSFELLGDIKIEATKLRWNSRGEVVERRSMGTYGILGENFGAPIEDPQFLEQVPAGTSIKVLAYLDKASWRANDGQFGAKLFVWDVNK